MALITFVVSLLLLSATAFAKLDSCGTASDVFINAGATSVVTGFRCDAAGSWASSNRISHSVNTVDTSATGCTDQYKTSTYAKTGDLVYTIPIPAGTYDVVLMFAEPVQSFKKGNRLFSVKVGNKVLSPSLDVVDLANGARKPYTLTTTASPAGGNIVVTLGRGTENPFINAIAIKGTNAAQTVGSAGLTSCTSGGGNSAALGACPKAGDIYINAGGVLTVDGYRCDVQNLWRTSTHKWSDASAIKGATGCTEQYKTHASNFGDLVYKVAVPAGSYNVSLMFAENYHNAANKRLFTLDVNGVALKNGAKTTFDIFALAGGKYTPYVASTTTTAVAGEIVISIRKSSADNPMISGIIISGTNADALIGSSGTTAACVKDEGIEFVDLCPTAGTDDIYINAGGSFTTEGWRCDVEGLWRTSTHTHVKLGRPLDTTLTECIDVFKSHASTFQGDLNYDIPVPNGDYTVKLLFNENWPGNASPVGARKFKINVNGAALSAGGSTTFDIVALAGGIDKPYITSTTTTVTNGKMLIDILRVPGADNPMISGIIISGTGASDSITNSGVGNCKKGEEEDLTKCSGANDVFINAGGKQFTGFRCDVPGQWATSLKFANTDPITPALDGCSNHYLTHSYVQTGDLTYNIPVPAGTYDVYLYFMENYKPFKVGSRVFTVSVNDVAQTSSGTDPNFDIVKIAGGSYKPWFKKVTAKATDSIKIVMGRVTENPFISGIGIVGSGAITSVKTIGVSDCSADTPKWAVDKCPVAGATYINAGGSFTSEGYRCDVPNLWRTGNQAYPTTLAVDSTATGCLDQYKSHAYAPTGDLVYTIPVPSGNYVVDMMFSENYTPHVVGSRKFTVKVNDEAVSPPNTTGTEFDIVALAGGTNKPYMVSKSTEATPAGIVIKIGRLPGGNNPMISGIVITGSGATSYVRTSGDGNCMEDDGSGGEKKRSACSCPESDDVFINAGGKNIVGGMRCDIDGKWASPNKMNYSVDRAIITRETGGCSDQYKSSSYAPEDDLVYTVPVSAGDYCVYLGFMEPDPTAVKGFRLFTITINGQAVLVDGNANVDIFYLAGGVDKPYLVSHNTSAVGGNITVTLGRTASNNPFLSFINIVGTEAASEVGILGLSSCKEETCETPKELGAADAEFDDDHTAHAVSGGPYVATDFSNAGNAKVELNALQSHSHGVTAQGTVDITQWIWSWNDPTNPDADPATGKVLLLGPTPAPVFPVGNYPITLEVRDDQCARAIDTTSITVDPARKPGAYCYFYDYIDSESEMVPIEEDIKTGNLPSYAKEVGDINFANAAFNMVPFSENSYAVRCVFSKESTQVETLSYKIMHSGPIKVFTDGVEVKTDNSKVAGKTTTIPSKSYAVGIHEWQILYFRPKSLTGKLQLLKANNQPVPAEDYGYDASMVLPVITGSSKTTSASGSIIKIFGSGFFNGVGVKFGMESGQTIQVTAKEISVEVPVQEGDISSVSVTVSTNAGVSNGFTFQYPVPGIPCQSIKWVTTSIKAKTGPGDYIKKEIIVIKYGPDGRLYAGTRLDSVLVLELDKNLKVTYECEKKLNSPFARRDVLGLNFNPASPALKLYITTATINWKKDKYISDYVKGWTNGKVQSITANAAGCFNNDITDVVTGLPVSNHDHTPSWIEFLPDGRMLVSIGGFTNGGISIESDKLGGIPANPYSGAIITCPSDKLTAIKYTNPSTPDKAKVIGTGGCSIYAPGFRNSFGGHLATNGELYVTDNSPNDGYGEFSKDCTGEKMPAATYSDLFFKVEEGKCHGHPHIPRALENNDPKQCVFRSKDCVQPLWDDIPRSTNGIVEYRSNLFAGVFKGNIFLSKYSVAAEGRIQRLIIDENTGDIKKNGISKNWHLDSGLHMVEGPRGELIMNRMKKDTFFVRQPGCQPAFPQIYLIGVHPKRGPWAGGHKVLITGFNFGSNIIAKFGANECTNVQVIDDTQFTCLTPEGTPNTQVKVEILGAGGETNWATEGTDYWYW